MATKGYNSYRGRVSAGRIVLVVVLVLVLLGAIGYLVVQITMPLSHWPAATARATFSA